jgi:hypothetical protein
MTKLYAVLVIVILSAVCSSAIVKKPESVAGGIQMIEKATSLAQSQSSTANYGGISTNSNALTDAIDSMRHWRNLNDPNSLKEKRIVLMILAGLVVLLYWILLTQFALPASKSANIELRKAELDAKMSDFEKLVYLNQMKKKERMASDLN